MIDGDVPCAAELQGGRCVLSAGHDGGHVPPLTENTCRWPGCRTLVVHAMWACKEHWQALPRTLQRDIWRTFRPGRIHNAAQMDAYRAIANQVFRWIRARGHNGEKT